MDDLGRGAAEVDCCRGAPRRAQGPGNEARHDAERDRRRERQPKAHDATRVVAEPVVGTPLPQTRERSDREDHAREDKEDDDGRRARNERVRPALAPEPEHGGNMQEQDGDACHAAQTVERVNALGLW